MGSLESCSYPESACFSPGSQLLVVLGEGVCEGKWVDFGCRCEGVCEGGRPFQRMCV